MKKLHLVGFTPDSDGLILSPRKDAKSGGFVLALDDALVSAIELARRRRDGEEPPATEGGAESDSGARGARSIRPRSALSPREIQARLRAGSSISDVASQAGVDEEWVVRFAAPILAEQAQVVESAQRLTLVKSRRGPSIEPLAPSVQWNLSDRGVWFSDDVFGDSWTAYNLHGARWAVRFAYTSRKRRQIAEWEVDLRERSLVARNRLATELGHVEAGRRRPNLEPSDPGAVETGPSHASGREARAAASARALPASSASSPGATAPNAKRPAARKGPTKAAPVNKARVANARVTNAAATKAAATKAAATKAVAAKAPATKAVAAKAPATKAPAGKVVPAPKASATRAPATKAGATKAAPATKAPAATATKRNAAVRAGATKVAATKVAPRKVAATKVAPRKVAATKVAATKVAARRVGRESSPRKARPAKKPAGDRPGDSTTTPTETYSDRPSHLARPPSPMKMANRATSYPTQRLTGTYARQAPPSPEPVATARPRPAPPSSPQNPRFEPGPEPGGAPRSERVATAPAEPPEANTPPAPGAATGSRGTDRARDGLSATAATAPTASEEPIAQPPVAAPVARRPVAPRPVAPRPVVSTSGGASDERPAVVILSTPVPELFAGPGSDDGGGRLASADRRRAAISGPAPASGAGTPPTAGGDEAGGTPRSRRQAGRSPGS